MDVALDPNFARNPLIYFVYSKPGPDEPAKATTAVARARWDGGSTLTDVKDIFAAEPWFGGRDAPKGCCGLGPTDASFGARMVFDKARFPYVTLGDRNYGEKSQDPSWDWGKIVRLRDDGTVPADNPFVKKEGYRPEIYTLGHRNPLGLTIHPVTGEMWSTEFGPRGGDELNLIKAGGNYGWITTMHGTHYDGMPGGSPQPGMEEPVLSWVPSINPGNLTFYYGDKYPAWRGNMLLAALTHCVLRVTFDAQGKPTGQEKMLIELNQRLRDLRVGPDGYIYLLTDETFGAMLRMEPAR
jgi:glucose/arabinose dehydrogenase